MTQLYTGNRCYTQSFCRMEYYPGLLPLSENELIPLMADPGIIIGDLLPVGVTFHIQYSFSFQFPSLAHTRNQRTRLEQKLLRTTNKIINNCHIWVLSKIQIVDYYQ